MDRLAQRGVRFDLAYANQAVCAPSRINLMSGARSTSSGIYNFGMNLRDYMPEAVTLPQYFILAGYHPESMGKFYHIGHGTVGATARWRSEDRPFGTVFFCPCLSLLSHYPLIYNIFSFLFFFHFFLV